MENLLIEFDRIMTNKNKQKCKSKLTKAKQKIEKTLLSGKVNLRAI